MQCCLRCHEWAHALTILFLLDNVLYGILVLLRQYSLTNVFGVRGTNRELYVLNDHGLLYPASFHYL